MPIQTKVTGYDMEKQAYMIKAHDQPKLLRILLKSIDSDENDIILHLDKKANFDYKEFRDIPNKSKLYFIDRQSETWGGGIAKSRLN